MTDQPALPPDDLEPEDLLPEEVVDLSDPVVPYVLSEAEEHAREGKASEGFFDLPSHAPPNSNAPHLSND
jgi:hypothetical protein